MEKLAESLVEVLCKQKTTDSIMSTLCTLSLAYISQSEEMTQGPTIIALHRDTLTLDIHVSTKTCVTGNNCILHKAVPTTVTQVCQLVHALIWPCAIQNWCMPLAWGTNQARSLIIHALWFVLMHYCIVVHHS